MSTRFPYAPAILAFALATSLVVWRITIGVDLSDESYYALFVYDWLLVGIEQSQIASLHQTAALVVYPFAIAYHAATGGVDGLFLFLRVLYVGGALFAATLLAIALVRSGFGHRGWVSGLMILAFIPYGLPAPSYNTIGLQGVAVGLAAFLVFTRSGGWGWAVLSGIWWAFAVIAYPPLVGALIAFVAILALFSPVATHRTLLYVFAAVLAAASLVSLAIFLLTPEKIMSSYVNTSATNATNDLQDKLFFTFSLLSSRPIFGIMLIAAVVLGVLRAWAPPFLVAPAGGLIVVATLIVEPALFVRSHDLVVLVAVMGLAITFDLRSGDPSRRAIAIVYVASMVAGVCSSVFATHSIYSFPVGGAVAAAISAAWSPSRHPRQTVQLVFAAGTVASLLAVSVFFRYGETALTRLEPREFLSRGIFAGLSVPQSDAELIDRTTGLLHSLTKEGDSIAMIGRLPGLMLTANAHVAMLTTFPLMPDIAVEALEATKAYYRDEENLPHTIVRFSDPHFLPVDFLEEQNWRYDSVEAIRLTSDRTLEVLQLRQTPE